LSEQARELWSSLSPHERSRSIENHVRVAASAERSHTARLVMLSLKRDEVFEHLRFVRDSCASWAISEAELVQTLLALQPRRLAGMGEAELLYALVDLLPPDQAARLMQHMALLGSLPPVRKQLARAVGVSSYVRALPQSPGGVFGPTPLEGKPAAPSQLHHASAAAAAAETTEAAAITAAVAKGLADRQADRQLLAEAQAARAAATTEAALVAEARGGALTAMAKAAASKATVTATRAPRRGGNLTAAARAALTKTDYHDI